MAVYRDYRRAVGKSVHANLKLGGLSPPTESVAHHPYVPGGFQLAQGVLDVAAGSASLVLQGLHARMAPPPVIEGMASQPEEYALLIAGQSEVKDAIH
jgi:hypothetical protein